MALYERESEHAKQQEDAARPGPPYQIAATKIASRFGINLHGAALDRAPLVMHYGLALSWSPLYAPVRRTRRAPRRGRVGHRCRDVVDRR